MEKGQSQKSQLSYCTDRIPGDGQVRRLAIPLPEKSLMTKLAKIIISAVWTQTEAGSDRLYFLDRNTGTCGAAPIPSLAQLTRGFSRAGHKGQQLLSDWWGARSSVWRESPHPAVLSVGRLSREGSQRHSPEVVVIVGEGTFLAGLRAADTGENPKPLHMPGQP